MKFSRSVFHPHGANLIDLAPRSGLREEILRAKDGLDLKGWQEVGQNMRCLDPPNGWILVDLKRGIF